MKHLTITAKQRGDTIVEVLLSMAVLGMVLGTSFAIVNRSLAVGRDAQERSEALKFAEAQLEYLKSASSDPDNGFFTLPEGTIYCMTNGLTRSEYDVEATIPDSPDTLSYSNACRLGPDGRYRVSIKRSGSIFTVRVRWDSLRGSQLNEARLQYRTYEYRSRETANVLSDTNITVSGTNGTVRGIVIEQGTSPVTERGFFYSTTPGLPPGSGTKVVVGSGTGPFSTTLSGLTAGTTYYVRAYATNSSGTYYGAEISFTAVQPQAPSVTTDSTVGNLTMVGGTVSGNVTADNGSSVTRKGVVVGRNPNPQVDAANARTINDGIGTGPISVDVGGLLPSTQYYARTFATNGEGTAYGNQISFTTSVIPGGIPIAAATQCEGSNSTYYVSTQSVDWVTARQIAQNSGGHLVTITNAQENACVAALAAGIYIWIGANDIASEGRWVWEDTGTPFFNDSPSGGNAVSGAYTNWAPGEPNDYLDGTPGEDGAVMNWVGAGQWNDWISGAGYTARFVIEYD